MNAILTPCPGCGAWVPQSDGPTHRYLGAAPGCWALYGEVLARGYAEAGPGDDRALLVNAYTVQHPGTLSPQSIQSVAVHLIGLWLALEQDAPTPVVLAGLRVAADNSAMFDWLEPQPRGYPLTILDLHRAVGAIAYRQTLWAFGRVTWETWAAYHSQVEAWAVALRLR